MRLLRKTSRLSRFWGAFRHGPKQELAAGTFRRCGIEELEPRQLMAGDVHLGAVYFEEASGDDSAGDRIEITFAGGQPGTQLNSLTINGDKLLDGGVTLGDIFFDTAAGGKGSFKSVPLSIVGHDGFTISNVVVEDGSPLITFQFSGFDAGEKLVFEIDVDEQGLFSSTSVAEGGEFEGSQLTGTFINQHYEDTTLTAVFFDEYDQNFVQAAQQSGSQLNLPRTATYRHRQWIARTAPPARSPQPFRFPSRLQFPAACLMILTCRTRKTRASSVSRAYHCRYCNGTARHIPRLERQRRRGLGDYKFQGLLPGKYRVVETQPGGYLSVGSRPGTINGQPLGVSVSPDIISEMSCSADRIQCERLCRSAAWQHRRSSVCRSRRRLRFRSRRQAALGSRSAVAWGNWHGVKDHVYRCQRVVQVRGTEARDVWSARGSTGRLLPRWSENRFVRRRDLVRPTSPRKLFFLRQSGPWTTTFANSFRRN